MDGSSSEQSSSSSKIRLDCVASMIPQGQSVAVEGSPEHSSSSANYVCDVPSKPVGETDIILQVANERVSLCSSSSSSNNMACALPDKTQGGAVQCDIGSRSGCSCASSKSTLGSTTQQEETEPNERPSKRKREEDNSLNQCAEGGDRSESESVQTEKPASLIDTAVNLQKRILSELEQRRLENEFKVLIKDLFDKQIKEWNDKVNESVKEIMDGYFQRLERLSEIVSLLANDVTVSIAANKLEQVQKWVKDIKSMPLSSDS